MSDRVYHPPLFKGERTPATVVSCCQGEEFSLLRQRRYLHNGGSFIGRGPGIAIFIDGCCLDNGRPYARAGMGVYFGPGSMHNLSEPLLDDGPKKSNRAEIHAAILALRKVHRLWRFGDLTTERHIAIIADSSYVVKAMTEWVNTWRENGWMAVNGERVVNADDFIKLENMVRTLEGLGMTIRFWHVGRGYNEDADELARQGARKKFATYA